VEIASSQAPGRRDAAITRARQARASIRHAPAGGYRETRPDGAAAAADSGSGKARPGSTPAAPLPGEVWAKPADIISNVQNTPVDARIVLSANNKFGPESISKNWLTATSR